MAGLDPWAFSPRAGPMGIHAFVAAWMEAEKRRGSPGQAR